MSDEFIKVATKEIEDEIASIKKILEFCGNDSDITNISESIEKHTHKIKGLAPMMGNEKIGEMAVLIDNLIKHVINGKKLEGIYSTLCESTNFMDNSMQGSDQGIEEIKQKIATKYSKYLD